MSLPEEKQDRSVPLVWGAVLLAWLVALCIVPDPRPLSAPDWAVSLARSAAGVSESTGRLMASFLLRGAGVAVIGLLLTPLLRGLNMRRAAPIALVAAPLLGLLTKWIDFGFFPDGALFLYIAGAAVMGALLGLALRRSRLALAGLIALPVGLYAWGTATGISDDLYEMARITGEHVLDHADEIPYGDEGFTRLFEVAFDYAAENSRGTGAVHPNRAAILALGVILGEDRVAEVAQREVDPGSEQERLALRRRIRVHGRGDLSQHFWVSAALTILSDPNRALTVGTAKELKDSVPGGSGFSFVDLAADMAGIRFAVVATRNEDSAEALQERIAGGVAQEDFFPPIDGLPEGIVDTDFASKFGGRGGARTTELIAEIERRIATRAGSQ